MNQTTRKDDPMSNPMTQREALKERIGKWLRAELREQGDEPKLLQAALSDIDAREARVAELEARVRDREAEILRIRTAEVNAACQLEKVGLELGVRCQGLDILAEVRRLRAAAPAAGLREAVEKAIADSTIAPAAETYSEDVRAAYGIGAFNQRRAALDAVLALLPEAQVGLSGGTLESDNETLRYMLAIAYSGARLYRDDGELQDGSVVPAIDFRRDSVAEINRKIGVRATVAMREVLAPSPGTADAARVETAERKPIAPSGRDWTENGNYVCRCIKCKATFFGPKGAVACAQCRIDARHAPAPEAATTPKDGAA